MADKPQRRFEDAPLGYKFKRIHEMFRARMNVDMKESDLTFSQMEILFYLEKHSDHAINQQELCDAVQVSHPTMIGLINRMEEKDLVVRRTDPLNRRSRYIEMTQKSQEILRQTRERRHRNDRMLVKGFTDEETKELNRLLGMVYRNMQSEEFLQER